MQYCLTILRTSKSGPKPPQKSFVLHERHLVVKFWTKSFSTYRNLMKLLRWWNHIVLLKILIWLHLLNNIYTLIYGNLNIWFQLRKYILALVTLEGGWCLTILRNLLIVLTLYWIRLRSNLLIILSLKLIFLNRIGRIWLNLWYMCFDLLVKRWTKIISLT